MASGTEQGTTNRTGQRLWLGCSGGRCVRCRRSHLTCRLKVGSKRRLENDSEIIRIISVLSRATTQHTHSDLIASRLIGVPPSSIHSLLHPAIHPTLSPVSPGRQAGGSHRGVGSGRGGDAAASDQKDRQTDRQTRQGRAVSLLS